MALATEAPALMADRDAAIRQYAPLVKYVVGRLAIARVGSQSIPVGHHRAMVQYG